MRNRKTLPEINAGSTADIAFLLLIFFLVTTTFPNEQGILRKLPAPCPTGDCAVPINERNLLKIAINEKGGYLLNEKLTPADSLENAVTNFLDNNGDGNCAYCSGDKNPLSSENPKRAVIVIQSHPNTRYEDYIQLQNTLNRVYFELRERYAQKEFRKPLAKLSFEELKEVKEAYPLLLSEASLR